MILSTQETPHFDLEHLSFADAEALRLVVQSLGEGGTSRQVVAERLVGKLFGSLRIAASGEPACLLVRCFQTATYAQMPTHYQDAADGLLGEVSAPSGALDQMRCLALLATRGIRTVWNDVLTSVGHQAIPLPSVEVVRKAPMITRLLEQLGMPVERAVAPPDSPDLQVQELAGAFNVFFIEQAVGSPFIPAQDSFVIPYGVRSVLGMGGILPDGELLAVVLFARVPISSSVAEYFGILAIEVRQLMLPFGATAAFGRADL